MDLGIVGVDFVYAPHTIYDRTPGIERSVYGEGEPVPMAEAIHYGLVAGPDDLPAPPPPAPGKRRSRRKVEDRAHHLEADR